MKQELKDLVKYRLERAENTLLDAQKYFKDATLSSTVNRIYYAMFIEEITLGILEMK